MRRVFGAALAVIGIVLMVLFAILFTLGRWLVPERGE